MLKEPLWGGAGGRGDWTRSALGRTAFWSSAASGFWVSSAESVVTVSEELGGLCHWVRPTARSVPPISLTHMHAHTNTRARAHMHAPQHACPAWLHKCSWPAGEGSKEAAAQAAGPAGPLTKAVGGDVGSQRSGGGRLWLGRDVAGSLTGHQQPQHLLFLTSKGNRFVSD